MNVSRLSRPYAEGLAAGVLRYQRCAGCGLAQRLARHACPGCGSTDLRWHDCAGTGTVVAVTEVRRAPADAWRALVPYTLVLVDLDEGARLMGHGVAGLAIGQRVSARVAEAAGQRVPHFAPIAPA